METKIGISFCLACLSLIFTGCKKNAQPDEFTKFTKEINTFNRLSEKLAYQKTTDIDSIKIYLGVYESIENPRLFEDLVNETLSQVLLPQGISKDSTFSSKIFEIISSKNYPKLYKITLGLQAFAGAEDEVFTQNAVKDIKDYGDNSKVNVQSRENCLCTIRRLENSLSPLKEGLTERYRLMIYNLLYNESSSPEYEYILDKVIINSKEILSGLDSTRLNSYQKYRASHRYYLAHAYYLKANLALKKNDRANALKYFQLSGSFSPDAMDRSVDAYYKYDQYFLHGFDEYSSFYENQLKTSNNPKAALDVLASRTIYDADNKKELIALYKQLYPSKSFNDYWKKKLDEILPAAPDFSLKSLSGKVISLSDYKGKWVVIDFWGTWCSFCVNEMPNVENLFNYINDHKKDKAWLLTIDDEGRKTSQKFMNDMHYHFPVLLADSTVRKSYKVIGLPTKFLVTPTGKYLEMPFNSNWQKTVAEFVINE